MKHIIFYFIVVLMVFIVSTAGMAVTNDVFPSFSSAYGNSTSNSYQNTANLSPFTGNSTSFSYRSYSGYLPAQVLSPSLLTIPDPNMNFVSPSPTSDNLQPTTKVTATVVLQNTGGNTVSSVNYRITNSGIANFNGWRADASATVINSTSTLYTISIPNTAGDSFTEGTNNYIQWMVTNNAGAQSQSSPYQIIITTNDMPSIVITQPDVKSEFTSISPYIAATITGGAAPLSVQVIIDRAAGGNVATVTPLSSSQCIFVPTTNMLTYKYDGPALSPGVQYKLTVTATDSLGKVGGSTPLLFIPQNGAIADLIPYPSPFDPKVQPVVIRYVLGSKSDVWINIYDMSGRIVKVVLDNQSRGPGLCEDTWNGTNFGGSELANGVYFCELIAKTDQGTYKKYKSLAIFGK